MISDFLKQKFLDLPRRYLVFTSHIEFDMNLQLNVYIDSIVTTDINPLNAYQ